MIHLRAVSKRYGTRPVLRELSLQVVPGEVVALVGPNGAGKSTALKVLVGLVRPDAGSAGVNGHDVLSQPELARALVGYVPQRLAFPDHVTPLDLCRLVAALRGIDTTGILRILDDVGLGDRRLARVRDLSGGQRQRLSLALALAGEPRALVLDEPSISLDADGAVAVCAAIARARQRGAAVLFASHHFHEVRALADRVAFIRDGRHIAEAGAETLRDPAAFEAFYRSALAREVADAA